MVDLTTDTHESDEQFVERMRDCVISFGGFRYALPMSNREDLDRLLSLTLRGAAVRWRPIEEAPPYRHVSVWIPPSPGKKGHIRHHALWCADEGKWTDENFEAFEVPPTHFIPLTALGEPDDK